MTAGNGKPCRKCGTSEWYACGACKQCKRERDRRQREANRKPKPEPRGPETREEHAARYRRHYAANQEKERARSRRWRAANQDKDTAKKARRRTRKTSAGGSYTAAEWNALVEHYGNKCLCCGRSDVTLTVDHVKPVSKGGNSNIDNLQPLCLSCNASKSDKIIDYRPRKGMGRWVQAKLFDW